MEKVTAKSVLFYFYGSINDRFRTKNTIKAGLTAEKVELRGDLKGDIRFTSFKPLPINATIPCLT